MLRKRLPPDLCSSILQSFLDVIYATDNRFGLKVGAAVNVVSLSRASFSFMSENGSNPLALALDMSERVIIVLCSL